MEPKKNYRGNWVVASPFTLLEVVVAVAVLGVGLVTFLSLTASTSKRMNKAYSRWEQQHVLSQVLEYFLLTNEQQRPPDEFFPYDEYAVSIEVGKPDKLPEGVEEQIDKWKLVKVSVKLSKDGEEVESIDFDKIIFEETE